MRMKQAEMAELAYAADLKSADLYDLVGSSPTLGIIATVAQLAEQRFCKPQVAGSSPVGGFRRAVLFPCNSVGRVGGC